jgi:hypothetical protein
VLFPLLLASTAAAQVRVKLETSGKPDALTQQVLRLGQDATRPQAMAKLIEAGRPAVSLLLRAVVAEDALSMPALRTLAEMGGMARPAVPGLQALGRKKTPLGDAARRAVAAIGERDSVVFCDWSKNCIFELDAAGTKLREVKVNSPWCVQVVEDDHLLVCCYNDDRVREVDWDGKEIASWEAKGPIWARRQLDGTMWVSEHKNKTVQRRAMDGSVIAKVASHARTFVVGLNDNLFLLEDAGKLREVTATGDAVREIALQNQPMALYVSPGGEIRVLYGEQLITLDAKGEPAVENKGAGGMAYAATLDGAQFFGRNGSLKRLDAKGNEVWQFSCELASCVVPRLEPADGR